MRKRAFIFVQFLNLALVSYFCLVEDFTEIKFLQYFAISCITLISVSLFLYAANYFEKNLENLALITFSTFFVISFFEITFGILPSLIPTHLNFLLKNDRSKTQKSSESILEYFEETPFVKFKGNTIVRSAGNYGPDTDFEYSWKTDSLGFKNEERLVEEKRIDAISLGDSFTEGMGVKLEETYPYLLNRKGLKTYNLGVQGSAPVQWLGYFRKFGIQMKPKLVLIGYLPTVYERESIFFHRTNQELPSAIGRIAKRNRRFEIRNQVHFVTTAIIYYTTSIILPDLLNQYGNIACMVDPRLSDDPRCLSNTQVEENTEFTIPYFSRYKSEYDRVKKLDDPNIIINSREWKSMLDQFLLVKRESDKIGAKVYIIFFPHREIVYFERALNKPLPSPNFSSVEEEHLQRFAVENNIIFLNSIPIFREYIKTVDSKTPLENYPFLTVDGHLSKLGNSLLADFIFNNIKDRK